MKNYSVVALVAVAILAVQVLALYGLGHSFICECGYIKFWNGLMGGSENSQHLSDWYSFSHIIHGFLFYFFAWLIGKKRGWSMGDMFLFALALSVGWEILENTSFVIGRFRESTISFNYYGDSIINSVTDTLFAALGFMMASRLPVWIVIALAVVIELFMIAAIRDNLILNMVMIIYPLDFVLAWQAALSP